MMALETSTTLPVEEELINRAAWLIRLRWAAAVGVIFATWLISSVMRIRIPYRELYLVGIGIGIYNYLFHVYLNERMLGRADVQISAFSKFVGLQAYLDWVTLTFLLHYSGGIESPARIYYIFHAVIISVFFTPLSCYTQVTAAIFLVGIVAALEYYDMIPHVFIPESMPYPLYRNNMFILSRLLFFATTMYITVYLTTSISRELRKRDRELVSYRNYLTDAYHKMEVLYDLAQTIGSTLDFPEVLNLIAQNAVQTMDAKACSIRLLDETGKRLEISAAYNLSREYLAKGPVDVDRSLIDREALLGKPVVVLDATTDERFQYPEEAKKEGIKSVLCVPLVSKGRAIGVVRIYSSTVREFSGDEVDFLSALANFGAIAIENARTYQRLEQINRAKSEFVLTVTHELRAPLAAIQSLLRALLEGYFGEIPGKARGVLQKAERRAFHFIDLVNDLLDLADGKVDLTREMGPVSVNFAASRVVDTLRSRADEKGILLEVSIPKEDYVVFGSSNDLERVFTNLLGNAIKYTPLGGKVRLAILKEGDRVCVEVSDTGIGIPESDIPKIFDEFYRADNAKAVEKEGTGLGLAIVKRSIDRMNGEIYVESRVGEGSKFTCIIPTVDSYPPGDLRNEPGRNHI
ncbi:MAG: ATP-binding protein [bacterium]